MEIEGEKKVEQPASTQKEGVTPNPELEQAHSRIAQLEKELRGTQSALDRTKNARRENQDLTETLNSIKTELEMTRAFLAEASLKPVENSEDLGEQKPKSNLDAKLKDIETRNYQAQMATYANEVTSIFSEVGLDPNSAEEAEIVKAYFGQGTLAGAKKGVQAAIKVAEKIKGKEVVPVVKKEETPKETKETDEQIKARYEAEFLVKYGLKKPEATVSNLGNDDEFLASYARGESNDHKRARTLNEKLIKGG